MYGVASLLLLCSALLLMQASIAGARMQPQPRWITDNMQAYAVVPYIVTALVRDSSRNREASLNWCSRIERYPNERELRAMETVLPALRARLSASRRAVAASFHFPCKR